MKPLKRHPAGGQGCGEPLRHAGFTLLELMVVLAIFSIVALLGYPALQRFIVRSKTQGSATETALLLQKTRFEAIKRGTVAVVEVDTDTDQVIGFVDLNDADGNPGSDLVLNPPPDAVVGRDDFVVGRIQLPRGVEFRAPSGGAPTDSLLIHGFTDRGVGLQPAVVFDSTGGARDEGAFRIGDIRDNFLEIRISPPGTARMEIRKWNETDTTWYPSSNPEHPWEWNT
jgi:prepilin-type N-terminal cleavage/methylation domain-containing protein